jgi:glycine/D-amino acid oxidase-like deaminating enzyme
MGHPALVDATPKPFWLDAPDAPSACDALGGDIHCDLVVVGGGYTGLWTALLAKEQDPSREVVLLEGRTVGWAASGRNGGFCAASLTHGYENGLARHPKEMSTLQRLGIENLDGIEETVARYGIDCDFRRTGALEVAVEDHQVEWLKEDVEDAKGLGEDAVFLDRDEVRAELNSPLYLAGSWHKTDTAIVDPARLAWGLKQACLKLGVRIYENTWVSWIGKHGAGVEVSTGPWFGRWGAGPTVYAHRVALGTNVFPSPLRRTRKFIVPVYDYALMTEPLSEEQLASIGWKNRQGVGEPSYYFHYYRLTADNRILWGGYDVVYHWRNGLDEQLTQRPETFETLAAQFFDTFPQLYGLRFTHQWGGAIDTCSRFFAFQRTAKRGRVAYSLGYTGLGVGASRFGAQVMLDLLDGRETEATKLKAVRSRPTPFPPEPIKYAGIQVTQRAMARADSKGREGLWLRVLDRLGLGFDS